jgi:hypothetical protein
MYVTPQHTGYGDSSQWIFRTSGVVDVPDALTGRSKLGALVQKIGVKSGCAPIFSKPREPQMAASVVPRARAADTPAQGDQGSGSRLARRPLTSPRAETSTGAGERARAVVSASEGVRVLR